MTTIDFITDLFCCVDDKLTQTDKNQKHPQAKLYPSEVVTLALLFARKGVGNRAFYRWVVKGEVNANVTDTVPIEGEVGVRGVVSVSVVSELAASLDITPEQLYVRLHTVGMGLEADGVAPGFGGG